MDYNSLHGPGISNFSSSSSPHRLPTVSAAQALNNLNTSPTRCISTGLRDLDAVLQNRDPGTVCEDDAMFGGVSRGKVTEIWGPPGVGKTAFGMQLATSVLQAGEGVVWVDASHPMPGPRFSQILTSFQPSLPLAIASSSSPPLLRSLPDILDNLTHFSTPTLAHLIALLTHPTPTFPPPKTSLIIFDSFSTLINNAFPRNVDAIARPLKPGASKPPNRKFPILQYLINSFQKLAAMCNIAVVVLSQCVTKMRPAVSAVLVPAINNTAWEQGLGCRIALSRDWGWEDEDGRDVSDVRLADVVKAEGISLSGERRRLVGFTIAETGLQPLTLPAVPTQLQGSIPRPQIPSHISTESPSLPLPQKRKLFDTDLEIPDSEAEDDEDYGWAEEDEEDMPPMPPQWQGSEDILVPPVRDLQAEDERSEEEEVHFGEEADESGGEESHIERGVIDDSEDELAL